MPERWSGRGRAGGGAAVLIARVCISAANGRLLLATSPGVVFSFRAHRALRTFRVTKQKGPIRSCSMAIQKCPLLEKIKQKETCGKRMKESETAIVHFDCCLLKTCLFLFIFLLRIGRVGGSFKIKYLANRK